MSEVLNIFVRGLPYAQPRPRARAIPGPGERWIGSIYSPVKDADGHWLGHVIWKKKISKAVASMWRGDPIEGPIRVELDFYFPRPERLLKPKSPITSIPHIGKPDVDNLMKAVFDAMTESKVWLDDSQVCSSAVDKAYCAQGNAAGVRIVVERMADPDPELFPRPERGELEDHHSIGADGAGAVNSNLNPGGSYGRPGRRPL